MKMQIESKNILEESLKTGFNLFLGAGFSILAKDISNNPLPIGETLTDELKEFFQIHGNYSLAQLATILENSNKIEFYNFLISRFSIGTYDPKYNILNKFNIKGIYTTNIDNLIYKIFENNDNKYLRDLSINGPVLSDKLAVEYSALHGCVNNQERPLIFNSIEIASTYSNSTRTWHYLSEAVEKYPTIFWGYSLSDSGVLQALGSSKSIQNIQRDKWIIIREEENDSSDYYKSLGFNIIIGDTNLFLEYLAELKVDIGISMDMNFKDIESLYKSHCIPQSSTKLIVRPIKDFFLGNPPIWSDIYSKQITLTSHFSKAKDVIYSNKHLIITGTPASGKTTLLMQLAAFIEFEGIKLLFNELEEEKAELLIKKLKNRKALLFIDNFSDSIDAFNFLSKRTNIKLIGSDRGHNFGIVSHLIDKNLFETLNITRLESFDIQSIFNSLPASLRTDALKTSNNTDYEEDSLFEFVSRNVRFPKLKDRFKRVIEQLEKSDKNLAEFLVLCCYVHFARTPVSFDMLFSYFSDDSLDYTTIFSMRTKLGDLLKDYSGELQIDEDQEYYYPRSIFFAEVILEQVKPALLKQVIIKTLENIPTFKICSYKTFRRRAYDKFIINKAFLDWLEGRNFYERVFINDFKNPYVLQQGALFLAERRKFTDAFHWIDRAINMTDNKYFSIRNSHAIILFDANINSSEENQEVRIQLDKSMDILERCYKDDKRKTFHAVRYGHQAVLYFKRYSDDRCRNYLITALNWLKEELEQNKWNTDIHRMITKVQYIIL